MWPVSTISRRARHKWPALTTTLLLTLGAASCFDSGTSPSKSIPVTIAFAGVPFSATVAGRTVSAEGLFTFDLPPGDHELSGTFSGGLFGIVFAGATRSGGVLSGSLRPLQGVGGDADACVATWGDFVRTPRPFRLRFTVTTNQLAACQ